MYVTKKYILKSLNILYIYNFVFYLLIYLNYLYEQRDNKSTSYKILGV